MLTVLGVALGVARGVSEFLYWREEWDRAASPLAYWFALLTACGLGLFFAVLVHDKWSVLSRLVGW